MPASSSRAMGLVRVKTDDRSKRTVMAIERIYEGKVINLRIDTVLLPNGREASREIVEHNGAIAAVPMRDDGSIVMVRQHRHPAGCALLEIPAGGLNPGEDIDDWFAGNWSKKFNSCPGRVLRLFIMFVAPGLFVRTDPRLSCPRPQGEDGAQATRTNS